MKVAVFEVCRRPEVAKPDTEAKVLSRAFKELRIPLALYSNDGYWADRPKAGAIVDRETIRETLRDPKVRVVHFAVHGGKKGLVLGWGGPIDKRVEVDVLTGREIRQTPEFNDKLVVSGACGSGAFAKDFLKAGAKAFVAPSVEIPWKNLGLFFQSFYSALKAGATVDDALAATLADYPEYSSYQVYSRK